MAADVGTLQRLPKVIGNQRWVEEPGRGPQGISWTQDDCGPLIALPSCSLVNELAFTSRRMMADEALSSGLVR